MCDIGVMLKVVSVVSYSPVSWWLASSWCQLFLRVRWCGDTHGSSCQLPGNECRSGQYQQSGRNELCQWHHVSEKTNASSNQTYLSSLIHTLMACNSRCIRTARWQRW